MKKSLLIVPFILAIYAVAMTVVEHSFSSKKITFNTSFLKQHKVIKKEIETPISAIRLPQEDYRDVEKLSFSKVITEPKKIVLKEEISAKVKFEKKVVKKKINTFSLKKKEIKKSKQKINEITQNIIELDLSEKVQTYAYKKIKEINKTNWSITFEYSPKILANKNEVDKKENYKNMDTPIRISNIKKVKEEKIDQVKAVSTSDRISTKLSANEKSRTNDSESYPEISKQKRELEVTILEKPKKDDLVFFDYSTAEKDLTTNKVAKNKDESQATIIGTSFTPASSQASSDLSQINKEKDSGKTGPMGAKAGNKGGPIEPPQVKPPKIASNNNFVSSKMNTQKSMVAFKPETKNYISEYSVQPYGVNGSKKVLEVRNFEIRFDDDQDDILQSYSEGEINIKTKINSEMTIRRGTILSSAYYPTTLDFVFEANEVVAKIPMLEKDYLNSLVSTNKVTGFGGQLLVELDNTTEDVDIDAPFEKKIFLNKNLKQVERGEDDYYFILFLGVETGNTIISFRTEDNKTLNKIIHIEDSELYYEPNFYFENERDDFELTEEYLLSKEKGPLSLDPKQISGLTFEETFKKLTANRYRVNNVKYPLGMRSYIELKHLNESVYVGRWNNKVATVPSEQYMRFVLNNFKIQGVGSNCLVQINLPKTAKELYFNGQSKLGTMRMQVQILDKDGIFYSDLSNESEKIFLLGEEQGIINVKVKYVDDSYDFLQSYCSDSTYLVEQL